MTFTNHDIAIPIYGRSGVRAFALVDGEDYERVARHRWCFTNGYPSTRIGGRLVYMHRMILDEPSNWQIDHRNRTKTDNTRRNLRVVSDAENKQNVPGRPGKSSRFRGVAFSTQRQKWEARFGCPPKVRRFFDSEAEAAAFIANWREENLAYAED